MTHDTSSGPAAPIGREREVDTLHAFVEGLQGGPAVVVLEGEPGIGKTTLWRAGVDLAADRGCRILAVRPAEAEAKLSFAGLADLLDGADDLLERLPDPMRSALAVALLREGAGDDPTDARAVNAGVAAVLRMAGADGPTLIALDDAAWLDRATASALAFALRRLSREPIGLILCVRNPGVSIPFGIGRSFEPSRVQRLPIGPLPRDRLDEVVRERTGARLPPPVLDRLVETSAGNPFLALEIAAAAVRGDQRATGQTLPIPRDLRDDLIRDRLAGLSGLGREALLFAAACSHPTAELLGESLGGERLDAQLAKAGDAGLIETAGGQVRFVHPLYGSAIYADASRDHRHRVHRRLSEVVADPEERARHLALASDGPDPAAAAALDRAAGLARARGAPASAAELYDLAQRLQPDDRASDVRRLRAAAAAARAEAGDQSAALEALLPLVAETDPGRERAQVLGLLARLRAETGDLRGAVASFDEALREEGIPDAVRGELLAGRSSARLALGHLVDAERDARDGLRSARSAGDDAATGPASIALVAARAWLGRGIGRAPVDRALAAERAAPMGWSVGRVSLGLADLLARTGPVDEARTVCASLLEEAVEAGDETASAILHRDLGWLDILTGAWAAAEDHLRRAIGSGLTAANGLPLRAILSSMRGADDAAADARSALDDARRTGSVEDELLARSALGLSALSHGEGALAVSHLGPAWTLHRSVGIGEPAMFPFPVDLAEAAVEAGQAEVAREIGEWLDERGRALGRPWAIGAAARCRGLLASAAGDNEEAREELEEALRILDELGRPFDTARTLLALGGTLRRSRQKAASRGALDRAAAIFDELGSSPWAERARLEAARIGGRRASAGSLTQAEERVARLAAAGRTNREIADTLFMSVRTVEGHLSRVYTKRGLRSRTELALYFLEQDERESSP